MEDFIGQEQFYFQGYRKAVSDIKLILMLKRNQENFKGKIIIDSIHIEIDELIRNLK